jgi:hypothetical protein
MFSSLITNSDKTPKKGLEPFNILKGTGGMQVWGPREHEKSLYF